MSGLALRLGASAIVVLCIVRFAGAQVQELTPAEQEFAQLAARYARNAKSPAPVLPPSQRSIQQVAYTNPSIAQGPTLPAPSAIDPASQSSNEVIIPPSGEAWCLPPEPSVRTSSWTAAIELIPSYPRVTDAAFGGWTDDGSLALRLILGYEDPEGIGIRARFWGLSQQAETPADDVELNMGQFTLDLYKRIFLDRGELAIGAGPASGFLEFKLSDDSHSEFEGDGGSIFLDGYYGLVYFEKSELGAVARARYSIFLGDWRDTTGGVVIPQTDNDTMAVTELAWGLEYRRRFGRCEDHNWFVGVLAEYQRWQSDWMSNLAGTSIGVSGVNLYTGLNW